MMDRIDRIRQSFITRRIQQNDTQDPIERHDPDYFKNNQSHHDWSDHDEDMTDISVESLIIFLEGLKRDQKAEDHPEGDRPVNTTMQKAISAYTHESHHPQKRYTYLDEEDQYIDREQVNRLIRYLRELLADGVAHITLLPADGFLQSIELTVEKLRAV